MLINKTNNKLLTNKTTKKFYDKIDKTKSMHRYVVKLVSIGNGAFQIQHYDTNKVITFNEMFDALKDTSKYVVMLYGSNKLRPQYASESEITFIGLNRSQNASVLRVVFTPTRCSYEQFQLQEKTTSNVKGNVMVADGLGGVKDSGVALTTILTYGSITFSGTDDIGTLGGDYAGLNQEQLMRVYPFRLFEEVEMQAYDANGNALNGKDKFVKFPNFYKKVTSDENGNLKIEIASYRVDNEFELVYNHENIKWLYLGKYKASFEDNFLREKAGDYPKVSFNQASAINACPYYKKQDGEMRRSEYGDYRIRGAYDLCMIVLLNRNVQNKYRGMVDYAWSAQTIAGDVGEIGKNGVTDSIVGLNGEIANFNGASVANGKRPFKVLGVENPYGLIWENIYGAVHKDGLVYTYNGITPLTSAQLTPSDSNAEYEATPIQMPTSNGYYKGVKEKNGFLFPISLGGDSAKPFGDYYYYSSGWRIFLFGGLWNDGSDAGFYVDGSDGWSSAHVGIGFRLSFEE